MAALFNNFTQMLALLFSFPQVSMVILEVKHVQILKFRIVKEQSLLLLRNFSTTQRYYLKEGKFIMFLGNQQFLLCKAIVGQRRY